MTSFSPREIVSELDRFIVGQNDAKRSVAVALRNRWRRQQLPDALRERMGAAGRERMRAEFSVDTMAARHVALYESVLDV